MNDDHTSVTHTFTSTPRPLKRSSQSPESEASHPNKRVRMPEEEESGVKLEQSKDQVEEEKMAVDEPEAPPPPVVDEGKVALQFVEHFEEEVLCGCCAAILYNPVIIQPCNHYFCGSCTVLWVRNGGTSCPFCRQPSTSVQYSRLLSSFIQLFLKTYPDRERSQAERDQADEVFLPDHIISIPPPKQPEPERIPSQSRSANPPPNNLARPCPHCIAHNEYGWRCPAPLADPATNPTEAWNLDNGDPPGHAWCGKCDELHAVGAPSTSVCSVCRTSYCGLSVPHMCVANYLSSAYLPADISKLEGLITSMEVYACFGGNNTEVDVFFDWLREDGRGPRGVLLDMIEQISSISGGFAQLASDGVFTRFAQDETPAVPAPTTEDVPSSSNENTTITSDSEQTSAPSSTDDAPVPSRNEESTSTPNDVEAPVVPTPVEVPVASTSEATVEPLASDREMTPTQPTVPVPVEAVTEIEIPMTHPSSLQEVSDVIQVEAIQVESTESQPIVAATEMQDVTMQDAAIVGTATTSSTDAPAPVVESQPVPSQDTSEGSTVPPTRESTTTTETTASQDTTTTETTSSDTTEMPPAQPTPSVRTYSRICRDCSQELFFYKLYDWWALERKRVIDNILNPPPPPLPPVEEIPAPAEIVEQPVIAPEGVIVAEDVVVDAVVENGTVPIETSSEEQPAPAVEIVVESSDPEPTTTSVLEDSVIIPPPSETPELAIDQNAPEAVTQVEAATQVEPATHVDASVQVDAQSAGLGNDAMELVPPETQALTQSEPVAIPPTEVQQEHTTPTAESQGSMEPTVTAPDTTVHSESSPIPTPISTTTQEESVTIPTSTTTVQQGSEVVEPIVVDWTINPASPFVSNPELPVVLEADTVQAVDGEATTTPAPIVEGTTPNVEPVIVPNPDIELDSNDDGSRSSPEPEPVVEIEPERRVLLPDWVYASTRKDCPSGKGCTDQSTPSHAREFNHVIIGGSLAIEPSTSESREESPEVIMNDPPPPQSDEVTPPQTEETPQPGDSTPTQDDAQMQVEDDPSKIIPPVLDVTMTDVDTAPGPSSSSSTSTSHAVAVS